MPGLKAVGKAVFGKKPKKPPARGRTRPEHTADEIKGGDYYHYRRPKTKKEWAEHNKWKDEQERLIEEHGQ